MAKIYSYRNGEKAYFENDEKHVLTSEEADALYKNEHYTMLYSFIDKAVHTDNNISSFQQVPMSKIIEAYHNGVYTSRWEERDCECRTVDLELVFKNEDLVSVCVYGYYAGGESLIFNSDDRDWEEFLKEWGIAQDEEDEDAFCIEEKAILNACVMIEEQGYCCCSEMEVEEFAEADTLGWCVKEEGVYYKINKPCYNEEEKYLEWTSDAMMVLIDNEGEIKYL